MIIKTTLNIINVLRYIFAAAIIFTVLYTPSLIIDKSYVNQAINDNFPKHKAKKKHEIHIKSFDIINIENKVVNLFSQGTIKYKTRILGIKARKSFKFKVFAKVIPILKADTLTFKLIDINVKKFFADKYLEKLLKKKIQRKKIRIKELTKIKHIASIKNVTFLDNGDLLINYKLTKWLLLLIIIFLVLETKYILSLPKKTIKKIRSKNAIKNI